MGRRTTPRGNAPGAPRIKVMVVDDHPLMRSSLRELIELGGAQVVGEAEDGEEALATLDEAAPDVIVMDMHLPQMSGVEATRRALEARPTVRVLVLSSSNDKKTVIDAVRAGASGYLLKTATAAEVTGALQRVHAGELAFPAELSSVVLAELRHPSTVADEEPLKVGVSDRDVIGREGLSALLAGAGFEVVSRVASAAELAVFTESSSADVLVLDLGPEGVEDDLAAIAAIRRQADPPGVLVLSTHVEASLAVRLLAGERGGAGCLLKERLSDVDELTDAVRRVARGGSVVDHDVVSRLVEEKDRKRPLEGLTQRELEVLALMAEGRTNQAISERIFVSAKSVEAYVTSIFMKLGLEPTPDDHRRVLAVLAYLRS